MTDECPHDETTITDGNGRWIGDRHVQDRVEVCDDCGDVLGVL